MKTLQDFIINNPTVTETTWAWYGDNIKELKELLLNGTIEDIHIYYDRLDFKVYRVKINRGKHE